jgi:hypothetical protein
VFLLKETTIRCPPPNGKSVLSFRNNADLLASSVPMTHDAIIMLAIYIASGALTRSGNSATDDPELELWLVWQRQVTERFTKARTYSEVTMPPFPKLPKWVENREDFEAAINEL